MIPICITLSDISYSKDIFGFKIFNWMGKYSYSLYLGQSIAYSKLIGKYIFNTGLSHSKTIISFLIAAIIFGLVVMYISKLVSYIWSKNKVKIKSDDKGRAIGNYRKQISIEYLSSRRSHGYLSDNA